MPLPTAHPPRYRGRLILLAVCAIIVAASIAGVSWIQHKLTVVAEMPGMRLVPTERTVVAPPPSSLDASSTLLDLGYLRVRIPLEASGPLRIMDEEGLVVGVMPPDAAGDPHASATITFMWLNDLRADDWSDFVNELRATLGDPDITYPEAVRLVAEAQPITLWEIPRLGLKGTRSRLMLLAMKGLLFGASHRIEFIESDRVLAVPPFRKHGIRAIFATPPCDSAQLRSACPLVPLKSIHSAAPENVGTIWSHVFGSATR